MPDIVLRVESLGKKYLISHQKRERYTALRDVLANKANSLGRRIIDLGRTPVEGARPTKEEFWALKDVSFELRQGERLGIIGRNGAGKSTLLKLLSRITEPSTGRFAIRGRVASLLEVGTGFHNELTGRENIFLNGAILGMGRAEIKRKFDEIVDFSEVEKFLDTPVKRYSSGMYVRLAFAVAAHLEPDILIVDEVLAVGDIQFQKKCLGKMEKVGKEGRTVLYVSHNMGSIAKLCNKALLLSKGDKIYNGSVNEGVRLYLNDSNIKSNGEKKWNNLNPELDVYPLILSLKNNEGIITNIVDFNESANLELFLEVKKPSFFQVSFRVRNDQDIPIFTTDVGQDPIHYDKGVYFFRCTLPSSFLAPGGYHLHIGIHEPMVKTYFSDDKAISWTVEDTGSNMSRYSNYKETGLVLMDLNWDKGIILGTK